MPKFLSCSKVLVGFFVCILGFGTINCLGQLQSADNRETFKNYSLTIKFKEPSSDLKINKEYYFQIFTRIDKKSIIVTSNNGIVKRSADDKFDFVIVPKKIGKLTLRFYENKNGNIIELKALDLRINE